MASKMTALKAHYKGNILGRGNCPFGAPQLGKQGMSCKAGLEKLLHHGTRALASAAVSALGQPLLLALACRSGWTPQCPHLVTGP